MSKWRSAIQRMSHRKSTGICGWSPAELKLLPDSALHVLARIFHAAMQVGLPEHILRARVAVLAKVANPESIQQSRPIVVFSTLYRVWGSVIARQLLQAWSSTFHTGLMGSMPGRSARDLSYTQQYDVEVALKNQQQLLGVSIDLVKCFNLLPRRPLVAFLQNCGAPSVVAEAWILNVRKVVRLPCFCNSLEAALEHRREIPSAWLPWRRSANTCCTFVLIQTCALQPTWIIGPGKPPDVKTQAESVPTILQFVSALRLQVDWRKTWVWATTAAARAWWKKQGQTLFPTTEIIPVVTSRRELGVPFQFQKQPLVDRAGQAPGCRHQGLAWRPQKHIPVPCHGGSDAEGPRPSIVPHRATAPPVAQDT